MYTLLTSFVNSKAINVKLKVVCRKKMWVSTFDKRAYHDDCFFVPAANEQTDCVLDEDDLARTSDYEMT